MTKSLIIGCGNLGQNIISGFYKKKKKILICDKNKILLNEIKKKYKNFFEVTDNLKEVSLKKIEYIFLCIKPQQVLSVLIDIEDDGPGIPNKFKRKVFKPFFKIDDSRNLNQGGSGLGLSIANELIKKLKGKIYLKDSKKEKGTIFTISL